MQVLLYSWFSFIFLKEECKSILSQGLVNPGSAPAIAKTHKITQVECVNGEVPDIWTVIPTVCPWSVCPVILGVSAQSDQVPT